MNILKSNIIDFSLNTNIGFNFIKQRFANTVIMYHGISEKHSPYNKRHTLKKDFIKHLSFFKKHCNVITLNQFFKKEFNRNKINIAITFDDGYWNNYNLAKPILEEFRIPATFFITGINNTYENFLWADFVDILASSGIKKNVEIDEFVFELKDKIFKNEKTKNTLHEFIKYENAYYNTKIKLYQNLTQNEKSIILNEKNKEFWKLMNNNEIIESSKSNFLEIQSHGYFHNNLGSIDIQSAMKECIDSKNYLENLTQKKVDTIGFPDGSYSKDLLDKIEIKGLNKFTSAEGFLFDFEINDERILDRKGIYDLGNANNQVYNAIKSI